MQINAESLRQPDTPTPASVATGADPGLATGRHVLRLQLAPRPHPLPVALRRAGWHVHEVTTCAQARALSLKHGFCVGLLDLDTSQLQQDSEEFLSAFRHIRWIALLERQSLAALLENPADNAGLGRTIHDHCHAYQLQPVDGARLNQALGEAWDMAALHQPFAVPVTDHQLVGRSEPMRRCLRLIPRLAAVDAPVLIQGESGTGKELAAQAIHQCSGRAAHAFIAVNCGALPASLVHSELFGHERGAFSGASQLRIGRIEAADGGTLFLDEIGDLPLDLQVNLLRFLQQGTIERLGASRSIRLNVRVIAATHVDLSQAVEQGRFRDDLFYRLNVLHLTMPPLRERPEDITLLAEHAFRQFRRDGHDRIRGFSNQALEAMQGYHWPGNVRELINRVRRAMVLCDHRLVHPSDLELDRRHPPPPDQQAITTLASARQDAEKAAIKTALQHYGHNHSLAARRLGISRATLYRLLQRHSMTTPL